MDGEIIKGVKVCEGWGGGGAVMGYSSVGERFSNCVRSSGLWKNPSRFSPNLSVHLKNRTQAEMQS